MNGTERATIGAMFGFACLLWAGLIGHGLLFGWAQPTCLDVHSATPWVCSAPIQHPPHGFGVQGRG